MKKNKYILMGLLLLGFASCKDKDILLYPEGNDLNVSFYKNDDQLKQALYGVYDCLQHQFDGEWSGFPYFFGSVTSDDAVGGGGDQSDQQDFQWADRFVMVPLQTKNPNNYSTWKLLWKMNTRANMVIVHADALGTAYSKTAKAQAYFLKGFSHFCLARMYGGVPRIDVVPSINDKFDRQSIDETWATTEEYLKNALQNDNLPKRVGFKDPTDGAATDAAAQTLLGKVYLYEGKWQDAIDILTKVKDNASYALETDYANIFNPANKHGKESIFEINFTSAGVGFWDENGNSNTMATLVSPRTAGTALTTIDTILGGVKYHPTFDLGWGANRPTDTLAYAFDHLVPGGDKVRKNNSMISEDSVRLFVTWNKARKPTAGPFDIDNHLVGAGYFDLKHIRRKGFWADNNLNGQDIIVFRLADVYLMLAEASSRAGKESDAKTYLDVVRSRAKLSTTDIDAASGAALLEKIKKERQVELCLEGDRYFDLVRWYKLGDATINALTDLVGEKYDKASGKNWSNGLPGKASDGLFPIPQQEMDHIGANPNFPQNTGY